MELNMKESGKMIFNMGEVLKLGLMALSMMANTLSVGSMESEPISGTMALNIQGTGMKTKSVVSVSILG
jgi:hypothetical protein